MAQRHEEKYIISYRQYAALKSRALQLLQPDSNGASYIITSLYFDDPLDTALYEKLDGLPEHSKFRLRTYNGSDSLIRLERKDKHGILTQKTAAGLQRQQLDALISGSSASLSAPAQELAAQMRAAALAPAVTVRYRRDAFVFHGSDLRLTFDTDLEALPPDPQALFDLKYPGFPVLGRGSVIMEIKYGTHLPAFIRKLTNTDSTQLSVSKYALCRTQGIP